ncbi:MAG: hypothetical protein WD069_05980 [Planctomycetales bacterium]
MAADETPTPEESTVHSDEDWKQRVKAEEEAFVEINKTQPRREKTGTTA